MIGKGRQEEEGLGQSGAKFNVNRNAMSGGVAKVGIWAHPPYKEALSGSATYANYVVDLSGFAVVSSGKLTVT